MDPFASFFGGGGPSESKGEDADTEEYYDLLGVEKSASESQIKRAFRKLALKHHPDRGGDEELFKRITEAHDVLSRTAAWAVPTKQMPPQSTSRVLELHC